MSSEASITATVGRSPGRPPSAGRLWEIDLVRTSAIVMMVVYHAAWDVNFLAISSSIDPFSGGWRALQIACGSTFLALTGVTLAVMNARGRARGLGGWALYRRHVRRAATVLGAAVLVSVVTLVALGDGFVRFGILHCIGAAMLICPLLIRLRWLLVPLAGVVLWAGMAIAELERRDAVWSLPLGVPQAGGAGVDWYPLLPWLAPALFGLWLGSLLYPGGERGRWGRRLTRTPAWAIAAGAPGRHSLPIYLLHQPVLIPLVALAMWLSGVAISID